MDKLEIIKSLPYKKPFLFVDELEEVNENGASGNYCFPKDSDFYEGHFEDYPVTPGVMLTECMAQIGVVCLGIFLLKHADLQNLKIALSNTNIDFYLPVFPGEKVVVTSEKIYFRFHKLKCKVKMHNMQGKLICKGEISGMIKEDE